MYYVGPMAFNRAFSSVNNSNVILYIPGELRYAGPQSFSNQYILQGWTLQLGTSEKSSMFSFEYYNSLGNSILNGKPVDIFGQNAITGTINQGFKNVIIYSNKYNSIDDSIKDWQLFQYFIRENSGWSVDQINWTFYKGGANK